MLSWIGEDVERLSNLFTDIVVICDTIVMRRGNKSPLVHRFASWKSMPPQVETSNFVSSTLGSNSLGITDLDDIPSLTAYSRDGTGRHILRGHTIRFDTPATGGRYETTRVDTPPTIDRHSVIMLSLPL